MQEALENGEKAISLWKVLLRNKLIFTILYYSVITFYTTYGNTLNIKTFNRVKLILIDYNDVIVFVICVGLISAMALELLSKLLADFAKPDSYASVSVILVARTIEEIVWVLILVIAPVAYFHNTTFKLYWRYALSFLIEFIVMYFIFKFIMKKIGGHIDI